MDNLSKQEATYLQLHEGGLRDGSGDACLTHDVLRDFNQTIRAKMLKVYGEALNESGIAYTVGDDETKAAMQDMDNALHDALGTSPLQMIAKEQL